MRTLLLFCLLAGITSAVAQPPMRTRFFVLNLKVQLNVPIRTTLNPDKPISIDNRSYALLETDADSIGLLIGNETHALPFEPGKTYYFTMFSDNVNSKIVSEVSERVFWLTANVNNVRRSKVYFLSKSGGVEQTK